MPLQGSTSREPSVEWPRKQADLIESSGGTEGTEMNGMRAHRRHLRRQQVRQAAQVPADAGGARGSVRGGGVALGGAPKNPVWYHNLVAHPHVEVQDGTLKQDMTAREVFGDEKAEWWERAVAAFPNYAEYQAKTERVIPLFVLEPLAD